MAEVYPRHGFRGLGMTKALFNPWRNVRDLIYPELGSERPGVAEVLFDL